MNRSYLLYAFTKEKYSVFRNLDGFALNSDLVPSTNLSGHQRLPFLLYRDCLTRVSFSRFESVTANLLSSSVQRKTNHEQTGAPTKLDQPIFANCTTFKTHPSMSLITLLVVIM